MEGARGENMFVWVRVALSHRGVVGQRPAGIVKPAGRSGRAVHLVHTLYEPAPAAARRACPEARGRRCEAGHGAAVVAGQRVAHFRLQEHRSALSPQCALSVPSPSLELPQVLAVARTSMTCTNMDTRTQTHTHTHTSTHAHAHTEAHSPPQQQERS